MLRRSDVTPPGRRPWRLPVVAAVVGAAATGVAAHNAWIVRGARRRAVAGERDHAAVVGAGPGDPLTLVVCGDSAADGFGIADPREAFPHATATALSAVTGRRVEVVSLAVDGARTADLTDRQVPALGSLRPDVLVLSVGVNDAVARRRPADVRADTAALLQRATATAPHAQVVLVTCPDLGTAPGIPRPLRDLLGWSCRRVAQAQAAAADRLGVAVAPLTGVPDDPALFGDDGFHPGPPAQVLMAEAAVAALVGASRPAASVAGR